MIAANTRIASSPSRSRINSGAGERGGRGQTAAGELLVRLPQQRLDLTDLCGDRIDRLTRGDPRAQRHHLSLRFDAQRRIDIVEARLDKLKTFEIACNRQLPRAFPIAPR